MLCKGTTEKKKRKKKLTQLQLMNLSLQHRGAALCLSKYILSITTMVICAICSNWKTKERDMKCLGPGTHHASGSAMSGGHEENICCLPTRRLTLKMRKDSTSRQMLSQKKDCQNLYGSDYWQVSCGQPTHTHTHRFTHSNRQCHSLSLFLCPEVCEKCVRTAES